MFTEQRFKAEQSSPEPVLVIGGEAEVQEVLEGHPALGDQVHPLEQGLRQQRGPGHGVQELEAEVDHGPGLLTCLFTLKPLEAVSPVVHILHKKSVQL